MKRHDALPLRLALLGVLSLLLVPSVQAQEAVRVPVIPQTEITALTVDGDHLYAASYSHVYRSEDGGDSWSLTAALPPEASDLYALLAHDGVLYAGTDTTGVFVSLDHGNSWSVRSSGLAGDALRISAFAARGDSLYAATQGGVYVLNLTQPTPWQSFRQGLTAYGIEALAVSGTTLVASGGTTGSVHIRPQRAAAWTAVPLDAQDPQNYAYAFLSAEPYLLAGTAKGIYRSTRDATAWLPIQTALPASGDVTRLTTYGARIYAAVQHQGIFIYSSDDYGSTWTPRSQGSMPIYDLLGSHDRLWVARADGLWYYDLASEPRLFQAPLMGTVQGQPTKRGSVLATLDGTDLRLVAYFNGLPVPWLQMDLYRGDPRAGGEVLKNIGIAVPEGGGTSNGLETTVTLTDAQVQDLLDGRLYFSVFTLGASAEDLHGRIQVLPLATPRLLETSLVTKIQGAFLQRGTVLATLEEADLRLVGYWNAASFGYADAPVARIDLYRGALGEPGELLAILWQNFAGGSETHVGFDRTLPLSASVREDLLNGRLYLKVTTFGEDEVRSHLLAAPNQPPVASEITAPSHGATITVGGTGGADPVDPATPLTEITFTSAQDPDGHRVAYVWQASRSPAFSPSATVAVELGPDSTSLPLTVGAAAALFDALSEDQVLLDTPQTVYHRVLTTDGARLTYGPASTMTVVRGTITAKEPVVETPGTFALAQNYPNPFNPSTQVAYALPRSTFVRLAVYDAVGRQVAVLVEGMQPAGAHEITWDATAFPSGLYLLRLETAEGPITRRATLVK